MLGQRLLEGDKTSAGAWNFGPEAGGNRSVSEVLKNLKKKWVDVRWHLTETLQPHEANLLYLDSSKARTFLQWRPVWDLDSTLQHTVDWYKAWLVRGEVISRQQLFEYVRDARAKGELV